MCLLMYLRLTHTIKITYLLLTYLVTYSLPEQGSFSKENHNPAENFIEMRSQF